MREFISKNKWRIFTFLVLLILLLYFVPRQKEFYLESDIKTFKSKYLTPILIWTWVAISIIFLILLLIYAKSFLLAFQNFLVICIMTAFYLFIFQDIILGGALIINRQYNRGGLQKKYIVDYLAGTEKNKGNFMLYDLSSQHILLDQRLEDNLYRPELKTFDTLSLKFERGLFGIDYPSKFLGRK